MKNFKRRALIVAVLISTLSACGGESLSDDKSQESKENIDYAISSEGNKQNKKGADHSKTKNHQHSNENADVTEKRLVAFYGDITSQRIVGIDVKNMSLESDTPTSGIKPYTVGRADGKEGTEDKLYAITRNSPWVEILDINTQEVTGRIDLPHTPRSCAYNSHLGLQLITGIDKPMASLIDPTTDKVVATVGRDIPVSIQDNGGANATGHPAWITKNIFAVLDREARNIDLYKVTRLHKKKWNVTKISTVTTPTSAHHFIGKGLDGMDSGVSASFMPSDTFYAITEGSLNENIPPSLLELKLNNEELSINRSVAFDSFSSASLGENTTGHHATFHPDGKHIYIGSSIGKVLVVDSQEMKIVNEIITGEGSGHTLFIPQRNLGIVTNHNSAFISIINTETHTKIKDLTVSGESINDVIMQSHTSFTDIEGDFFYAFASNNGLFYEVDLSTLEVSRTLYTGGTPVQGCFTYIK